MKFKNFITGMLISAFAFISWTSYAQEEDIGNEYRVTLFPSYKITEKVGGFSYLGYVWNPEKQYRAYYLGWPCATYSIKPWMQLWGGLIGVYTDQETKANQLELRPFIGPKFFLPNKMKWNIYNWTRYEYRALQNQETKEWNNYSRIRIRFGVEIPLSSLANAWEPGHFYALADIEPFIRLDNGETDPMRIRGGLGYVMKSLPLRVEFIYHLQYTQPTAESGLTYTDNIYRLNLKLGLQSGILKKFYNPNLD